MHGIKCQSFANLGFLAFHVFHNFSQIGIRLQHFGAHFGILDALGVFKHNNDRILALANRFVNLPFCTTPLTNNLLYVRMILINNF